MLHERKNGTRLFGLAMLMCLTSNAFGNFNPAEPINAGMKKIVPNGSQFKDSVTSANFTVRGFTFVYMQKFTPYESLNTFFPNDFFGGPDVGRQALFAPSSSIYELTQSGVDLKSYWELRTDADNLLRKMVNLQYNVVRVFVDPSFHNQDEVNHPNFQARYPNGSKLNVEVIEAMADFIRLAGYRGLRVELIFGFLPNTYTQNVTHYSNVTGFANYFANYNYPQLMGQYIHDTMELIDEKLDLFESDPSHAPALGAVHNALLGIGLHNEPRYHLLINATASDIPANRTKPWNQTSGFFVFPQAGAGQKTYDLSDFSWDGNSRQQLVADVTNYFINTTGLAISPLDSQYGGNLLVTCPLASVYLSNTGSREYDRIGRNRLFYGGINPDTVTTLTATGAIALVGWQEPHRLMTYVQNNHIDYLSINPYAIPILTSNTSLQLGLDTMGIRRIYNTQYPNGQLHYENHQFVGGQHTFADLPLTKPLIAGEFGGEKTYHANRQLVVEAIVRLQSEAGSLGLAGESLFVALMKSPGVTYTDQHDLIASGYQYATAVAPTYRPDHSAPYRGVERVPVSAWASSEFNSTYPVNLGRDNNWKTRWASAATSGNHYYNLDLGDLYPVATVMTMWETAFSEDFEIHVSSLNAPISNPATDPSFVLVKTVTGATGGLRYDALSALTNCRHIRLKSINPPYNGYGHISLWEMKVFGPANQIENSLNGAATAETFLNGPFRWNWKVDASPWHSTYTPVKAIDGNIATEWRTANSAAQELRISLERPIKLDGIAVNWSIPPQEMAVLGSSSANSSSPDHFVNPEITYTNQGSGWKYYAATPGSVIPNQLRFFLTPMSGNLAGIREIRAYGETLEKLLVKQVSVSSELDPTNPIPPFPKEALFDGNDFNPLTGWASDVGQSPSQWIQFDLLSPSDLHAIQFAWNVPPTTYDVRVKKPGQNWVYIDNDIPSANVNQGETRHDFITFNLGEVTTKNLSARQGIDSIRIEFDGSYAGFYAISEVALFGIRN